MKNEFWTSAFRFNSVRNWWFQPYLVLNGSISCVVLIQPCACNVLSNNSLKHLERHETAVREECSTVFPLKWTGIVGHCQRVKDATSDIMFLCDRFSKKKKPVAKQREFKGRSRMLNFPF